MSAIMVIGIVRLSDSVATSEEVRKHPLKNIKISLPVILCYEQTYIFIWLHEV